MDLLETYGPFVKDQIHLQDQLADRYRTQEWRASKHQRNAVVCRALLRDLAIAQELINRAPSTGDPESSFVSVGVAMLPKDLEGLPEEVLKELNLSEAETVECNIIEVIDKAGGKLTLNKILIGMYRKTGTAHERASLNSRLHRMVSRGRLFSNVRDRRGIFSTAPYDSREDRDDMEEEEAATVPVEEVKLVVLDELENALHGPVQPPDAIRRSRRARLINSRP